ncbi:MAG: hypothetical protein U1D30_13070 [Planctomycetota bacterium]
MARRDGDCRTHDDLRDRLVVREPMVSPGHGKPKFNAGRHGPTLAVGMRFRSPSVERFPMPLP